MSADESGSLTSSVSDFGVVYHEPCDWCLAFGRWDSSRCMGEVEAWGDCG